MPNPDLCRLILDEHDDVLRIAVPNGMVLEFPLSPEQMVELNVWAFTRKTVHIFEGVRRVDPFTIPPRPRDVTKIEGAAR